MPIALIDIGSNTIRLVIYDNGQEVLNVANHANLIADVSGGQLSAEGLGKIVSVLNQMKKKASLYNCKELYAFATASLRDIADKEGLCTVIKELTGIEIEIISGDREAMYDYIGLKKKNAVTDGAAFDLGGGSCQLFVYETGKIREFKSLKIGSLKLHGQFVSGNIPDMEESGRIKRFVRKELSSLALLKNVGCSTIYAMGGAAFALGSLSSKYFGGNGTDLSFETLSKITELTEEQITGVCPKRLKTVIPASLTMLEIMAYSGVDNIQVTEAGVRDGILAEKFGS